MPKKYSTAEVEKSKYVNFFKKSLEFYQTMKDALDRQLWSSAGLAAVHAGISANDALLIYFHGLRSTSPDHQDAVNLTLSLMNQEGTKEAAGHLRKLIARKNLIEYEGKVFSKADAEEAAKHSERFINWVKHLLPKT